MKRVSALTEIRSTLEVGGGFVWEKVLISSLLHARWWWWPLSMVGQDSCHIAFSLRQVDKWYSVKLCICHLLKAVLLIWPGTTYRRTSTFYCILYNSSFYFPARSGTNLQYKSQLDKLTPHCDLQEKQRKCTEYMHSMLLLPCYQNNVIGPNLAPCQGTRDFYKDCLPLSLFPCIFLQSYFLHFVLLLLFQAVHKLFVL